MRSVSLALLLLLAACAPNGEEADRFTLGKIDPINEVLFSPGEGRTLARDWFRPELKPRRAPLYCYSTLGLPDCHADPIPEEQGRLKGYYGPPPYLN